MSATRSIQYVIIAALSVFVILSGQVGAAPPTDAAEVLEVKVTDAAVQEAQEERSAVLYRMEVLSILRSPSKVQPGELITVRSDGPGEGGLERGWIGTAYVNPDPTAAGIGRRFVLAADSGSLVEAPPAPPSMTFTREVPKSSQ